jgi:hypothetical protein
VQSTRSKSRPKTYETASSQRLGSYSFADAYYRVFTHELPVFISTDAILQAWHRSYVTILEELEETFLAPRLEQMIQSLQGGVATVADDVDFWPFFYPTNQTPLTNGVLDADFFLAVAHSLVTGTIDYGRRGQGARIESALAAVDGLLPQEVDLFGTNRTIDFSQFQVRGHYNTSPCLSNYFRAMMWCGLIDFQFTGRTNDNSLRELAGVVALHLGMERSGQLSNWLEFDRAVQTFVGLGDSLDFGHLGDLMTAANIRAGPRVIDTWLAPDWIPDTTALLALHSQIMSGQLGVQNIRNGYLPSPLSREQLKLPRSFAVMPQRFVLDSWAFTKVVFDDIIWDEDGVPTFEDKVPRRVPSALDVAFSVFANDQIVPDLAARIASTNGHAWRDGLPYQHNLAAVRNVIDHQGGDYWTNSIYANWLYCLRALSTATADSPYPEAMRTRAWAMRSLNTQLASWTQLRHDTVLYAKQSYTAPVLCGYPRGFVEPRPEFWGEVSQMALRTKLLMATLPTNGTVTLDNVTNVPGGQITVSLSSLQSNRLASMDRFIDAANTLRGISEKELNHTTLTTNEISFLEDVVERMILYTGDRTYSGWYPALFYKNARKLALSSTNTPDNGQGADLWDALVTDVHTDAPDWERGDPGSVLHEGIGNVHMAFLVVDCGGTNYMYAGPVLSHYEFELGPATRETDTQWKADARAGTFPPQPEWTREFLVPGPYTVPPDL